MPTLKTKAKGGDRVEQKLAEFARKLTSAKTVRIGFLENARYPNGTPVAMVAALQEYGVPSRGQPPRPFFRTMIAEHQKEWAPAMAALLKTNGGDVAKTLAQTGEAIAGQLRESIIKTNAPPLSPVTLMLRKWFGNHPEQIRKRDVWRAAAAVKRGESTSGVSTKPLVWQGIMLGSVDFEVK
jgi:hypothetical protein